MINRSTHAGVAMFAGVVLLVLQPASAWRATAATRSGPSARTARIRNSFLATTPPIVTSTVMRCRATGEIVCTLISHGGDFQQDHEAFMDWYATPPC
jgi:hypothetical protein